MSKVNGVLIAVVLVVLGLVWILALPAFNIQSLGFLTFMILAGVLITFALCDFDFEELTAPQYVTGAITLIFILIIIVGFFTTWKMFHVEQYRNIVTVEEGCSFEDDFQDVLTNDSNFAYVDLNTARKLGDRVIGNIPDAALYEVNDEYNLIKYKGEYYRLSPLEYAGWFACFKAGDNGIRGYVLVNAKTQAAQYVEIDGGFKYSPSAIWGKDLARHLRLQYPTYIFGNSYFEIDEEGKPYWITGVDKPTIGLYGGVKESKFVVTDAVTGESKVYAVDDLPTWIDHAYGLEYLMDNIEYHYDLVNGWWNPSKKDIVKTSYYYKTSSDDDGEPFAGYNSFIDANGDVCFYTGLTPANKAESNAGFVSINTRTGKVKEYRYDIGGIEEGTAIERAEAAVQNYQYVSTFPMMINIGNEPTYLMILKGKDGLIKQYALARVSTESGTIATGATLEEAISNYLDDLAGNGVVIIGATNETSDSEEITGKITEKYEVTIDGTTHFLYQLDNKALIYDSSIKTGYEQATYVVGDEVTISFVTSDDENVMTVKSITKK